MLAVSIKAESQIQQPIFVGNAAWVPSPKQHEPEILPVTAEKVRITKTIQQNDSKSITQRKIDPGTIILKTGPTLPLVESFRQKGKKLSVSEVIEAVPLLTRDNAAFNISYTDKQHGFAGTNTSDFAEDDEHNIWMASGNGLIKYDGYHYYLFNQKGGLPDMIIESLAFDSQKRLWLGSNKGVYFIQNDSVFSIQSKELDFSKIYCRKIRLDHFQRIWLSTKENGAICIDKISIQIYDKRCGLPFNYVHTTYLDKEGNIILGLAEHGAIIIKPDKMLHLFSNSPLMQYHHIVSIMQDEEGIWMGGFSGGLINLGVSDTIQYSISGTYTDRIYDIKKAPNGLWLSIYGAGLCYFNKTNQLILTGSTGLLNASVYYLFEDSFKNIWVSSLFSGFSRLNENCFYIQPYPNQAISNVSKILSDGKKGNWILSDGNGLAKRKGSTVTSYNYVYKNGIVPMRYTSEGVVNEDGSLWLNSHGAGIIYGENRDFTFYHYSDFGENEITLSVKKDYRKKVWFSTMRYGLIVYDNNIFRHYSSASGLLGNEPIKLFLDADKKVCCSFANGFQRFSESGIENLFIGKNPLKDQVNSLLVTDANTTLMATDANGLFIIRENKVYQLSSANGLLSNKITNIIQDAGGKIWITTAKGIESLVLNGVSLQEHTVFNQTNGSFILNAGPALLDSAGIPFWPMGQKMMVFNPVFQNNNNKRSPVFSIRQVVVDNKARGTNAKISILPNQKINIYFTAIFWGRENNLENYYLLISDRGDSTKHYIGDKGNILISEILPGSYRIVLAAKDNNSIYYSNPISIQVNNFWYNTWLFRIVMGCLAIIGIFIYFRKKSNRQKKLNDLLQKTVAEQTVEIRKEKEELFQSNQVINKQIEEKDVLIQEINHRVKNNLQFIAAMVEMQMGSDYKKDIVESLLGTSRRIAAMSLVHEMLYDNKDMQGLSIKKYISELIDNLKEMAVDNEHPIQINMDVADIHLDSKSAISLGMIISELVSNSFKHAFKNINAPEVSILLEKNNETGFLQLTVSDNGIGMKDSFDSNKGLGSRLVDIFSRQLDGNYKIDSHEHFIYLLNFNPQGS